MYWSTFIIKILAKCNNYYRNIINVERRVEHVVISKTFITFFYTLQEFDNDRNTYRIGSLHTEQTYTSSERI